MNYVKIDNDKWEDANKVFYVHSSLNRVDSTAVELVLEDKDGNIHKRVVASHQIEWLESPNW
jgi:hypothetical protein